LKELQTTGNKRLEFSLHFRRFQNDSFYTSKRAFFFGKMTHSGEQNGPFCDVKRAVLKTDKIFSALLFGFFTVSEAICALKRKKILPCFFSKFT